MPRPIYLDNNDARLIGAELGSEFKLVEEVAEIHLTPWGSEQKFRYFRFRRVAKTAGDGAALKPG